MPSRIFPFFCRRTILIFFLLESDLTALTTNFLSSIVSSVSSVTLHSSPEPKSERMMLVHSFFFSL